MASTIESSLLTQATIHSPLGQVLGVGLDGMGVAVGMRGVRVGRDVRVARGVGVFSSKMETARQASERPSKRVNSRMGIKRFIALQYKDVFTI